jgi:uncharacterized membrane protein
MVLGGFGVPNLFTLFGAHRGAGGALLMTAASCGTLCTPMAANFNLVPPNLFEMRDQNGVIKFQAPYAAAMLVVHILLLWGAVALM